MRHATETLAVILTCLFVAPTLAEDSAREIIEKGMKARSEKPELLEKQRCEIITMQGKMLWLDQKEKDVTGEILADWPGSFRWNRDVALSEGKTTSRVSIQIDKGWKQETPGPVTEMSLFDMEYAKVEMYGRWLATLYPLKDKAFTFLTLKESRVGEEDVSVVKVTLRLRPDVYMSFSKKTGHLLKVAYKARQSGLEVRVEHIFSDYKVFDGLMLPTKMTDTQQVGTQPVTKSGEWTITGYKFMEKMDESIFAKPEKK